jgi:hypothetical protein
MMRLFLLMLGLSLTLNVFAQDSWVVSYGGKTVLKSSTEDAEKNIVAIHPADLKKKKELSILYTEKEKQKGWERFIAAFDENDTEMKKVKGNKMKLDTSSLQALFKKTKTIKLYTWSLPTDPKLKASVRIRRVHLCTLNLQ